MKNLKWSEIWFICWFGTGLLVLALGQVVVTLLFLPEFWVIGVLDIPVTENRPRKRRKEA
jgi:hypothetical protein